MEKIRIVALDGAVRESSMTRRLLMKTVQAFDPERISVTVLDQRELNLPLFDDAPQVREHAGVKRMLEAVAQADAIILSSPEYHGSISGALKNALDWCSLVEGEFLGKVVGLMGGGGSLANSGANVQMMMAVRAMHGWLMPDVLLSVPGIRNAFEAQGGLRDQALEQRLTHFAERLAHYAGVFREQRAHFRAAA